MSVCFKKMKVLKCIAFLGLIMGMNIVQAKTLLILGDSLSAAYRMDESQGWVALLEQKFKQHEKDWRIINASVSGDLSSGALQRLPFLLKTNQPDALIIEIGANDGLQGKPFEHLADNIEQMIALAKAANAKMKIFLIQAPLPRNYDTSYIEGFTSVYKELAKKHGLILMPFVDSDYLGDTEYLQDDGLHPNEKAQPIILEGLWPYLDEHL